MQLAAADVVLVVGRTGMRLAAAVVVVVVGRTVVRLAAADVVVVGRTGMRLAADVVITSYHKDESFGRSLLMLLLLLLGILVWLADVVVVAGHTGMRLAADVVVVVGRKLLYSAILPPSNAPTQCSRACWRVLPSREWP